MGLSSPRAGCFERRDTGRLIGIGARRRAGVDIRDALNSTGRRGIEISVKHAVRRSELQLEARALAYLEGRISEMRDNFGCSEAHETARPRGTRRRDDRRLRLLDDGLLRSRRARSEKKRDEGDKAAHGSTMHAPACRGKVAAR